MNTPLQSNAIAIDAPVDGWDAFHSVDNMPPTAAIILDNLIPGAGSVVTRRGHIEFADLGVAAQVQTVASLDNDDLSALIAAAGGGIWQIDDTPEGASAQVVTQLAAPGTFAVDKWQTENFRKADETGIMVMCNGTDDTQVMYDTNPPAGTWALRPLISSYLSTWAASWSRIADSNGTMPVAGEWNLSVAQDVLRINWTDGTAGDQQDALRLPAGTEIVMADDADPSNYFRFRTTATYTQDTDFTTYPVTLMETGGTGATVGLPQTLTFELGIVETDFIGCIQYKGRMYYWKDNDNAFYYAQAGAYEGELRKYDLGNFAQMGGELIMIGTWTQQDSGDGKDDFIFFYFSTGEILIYQGDDPESIGFWEFVGRYYAAEPLSIRGIVGFGADTILMTRDGYMNLETLIQQGRTTDVQAFSRLIHRAIIEKTRYNYNFYGWDVELVQRFGLMLFNVPLSDESYEQHVLNTVTMRWCRFTDINVNCLEVHNERLFGGGNDGKVYAVLEGNADVGNPIYFTSLGAFDTLGQPGLQKHLTAAQIISTHPQPEYFQLTGYADYDVPKLTPVKVPPVLNDATWSVNPPAPPATIGSFWDEDYWAQAGSRRTTKGWQNVSAYGYSVALLVRFAQLYEAVEWRSTNLRYHVAGAQ